MGKSSSKPLSLSLCQDGQDGRRSPPRRASRTAEVLAESAFLAQSSLRTGRALYCARARVNKRTRLDAAFLALSAAPPPPPTPRPTHPRARAARRARRAASRSPAPASKPPPNLYTRRGDGGFIHTRTHAHTHTRGGNECARGLLASPLGVGLKALSELRRRLPPTTVSICVSLTLTSVDSSPIWTIDSIMESH